MSETQTYAETPAKTIGAAPLLSDAQGVFAQFNKASFAFPHRLAGHPAFSIDALRDFAKRLPSYHGFVYWQNGKVRENDLWSTNTAERLSLDDTIAHIAENDSLVILKHAEQDPELGPILQQVLTEIVDYSPPSMRDDATIGESLIFLNSPRRKTAYHIDLESNFLLQVSGEKDVHVFDGREPGLLTAQELENHCAGDLNGAVYKPHLEGLARRYQLEPGMGVHFPSMAPHWVENGDSVSVSININYELRSVHHRLKHICRMNKRLRKLGFEPQAPGVSGWKDNAKLAFDGAEMGLRRMVRKVVPKPNRGEDYPVWRVPKNS
jgi:hypothetical protein